MKKTISLLLVAAMICSMGVTTAFATTDAANGTTITYSNESAAYTVTVPASLAPGESGTVTATGVLGDTHTLIVTADKSVALVNGSQSTDVAITFPGIEMVGNNFEQTATATVAVGDVQQAMFGTWTGTLNYNVELKEEITFTVNGVQYKATPGMTWNQFVGSEYGAGFSFNSNFIMPPNGGSAIANDNTDGDLVSKTDVIVAGRTYVSKY